MTINGRRKFVGNDGRKYYVQDLCKQDKVDDLKYMLTVDIDGRNKLCYDPWLRMLKFATIKNAQRFVMYNADFIETM